MTSPADTPVPPSRAPGTAPNTNGSAEPPSATFGIIARRRIPELDRLVGILLAIEGPGKREIVIGVETPGCDQVRETVDANGVRWLDLPPKRGVGYNRNRVLDAARHEVIFSIDDDCVPQPGWYEGLLAAVSAPQVDGAVGDMRIPSAGFIGDAISALGFPAGGNAGYETMFPVGPDGTTTNIPGGNCALSTAAVREIGGYDETMTFGGEDTELAWHLTLAGKRLVFVRDALMEHPARTDLREFTRWLFVRGRAKRQFARKVPVGGFVGNRLRSMGRIVTANARDPKIVVIVPLLIASLLIQQAGFLAETIRPTPPPAGD